MDEPTVNSGRDDATRRLEYAVTRKLQVAWAPADEPHVEVATTPSDARDRILADLGLRFVSEGPGRIWRCARLNEPETAPHVCVKVTNAPTAEQRRTIQLASEIESPGLSTAFQIRESAEMLIEVSEWIEGRTLGAMFDGERGPLADRTWMRTALVPSLVAGMDALHNAGLLHRDISPENVLVSPAEPSDAASRDSVSIIDFGSAVPIEEEDAHVYSPTLDATWAYASPESLPRWRDGTMVRLSSKESDYYSLGAVLLYVALGGKYPLRHYHYDHIHRFYLDHRMRLRVDSEELANCDPWVVALIKGLTETRRVARWPMILEAHTTVNVSPATAAQLVRAYREAARDAAAPQLLARLQSVQDVDDPSVAGNAILREAQYASDSSMGLTVRGRVIATTTKGLGEVIGATPERDSETLLTAWRWGYIDAWLRQRNPRLAKESAILRAAGADVSSLRRLGRTLEGQ